MVIPGFLDPDGRLFTKVKRPEWRRPDRVELATGDSELHIWRSLSTLANENAPVVHPPSDLLERFLALQEASGPQLCKFVRKYGSLEIFRQRRGGPGDLTELAESLDPWCRIELCEVWRYFAAVMGALLRIAKSVYSNLPGDSKDWSLIANCPWSIGKARYAHTPREAGTLPSAEEMWLMLATSERSQLASADETPGTYNPFLTPKGQARPMTALEARSRLTLLMNILVALGEVRHYFAWTSRSDQPQILYAGDSLLSYLVLQLCLKMAKIDGYAFCDHCGKLYEPQRLPRSDRRNFCPTCQDNGISARLADRKRREKERIRQRHAVR